MRIAVTGATGFLGRYLVQELASAGHQLQCWYRVSSDRSGFDAVSDALEWIPGELGDAQASTRLVANCDAVVHSALYHPGGGFRGGEGDLLPFVERNVLGTLRLIEDAIHAQVPRFVFISTCAVHEKILDDRPLDETHPLWPTSHYGAHKGAIEKFVHSFGLGQNYPICALRPTGIYGLAHRPQESKWFDLVERVVRGETVECRSGGKEVHAADVARAVSLLLQSEASAIAGQAFNCYDRYVSQWDVAHLAKRLSGSSSEIHGQQTRPKHEISTAKLRSLGMQFDSDRRLEQTVEQLVAAVRR